MHRDVKSGMHATSIASGQQWHEEWLRGTSLTQICTAARRLGPKLKSASCTLQHHGVKPPSPRRIEFKLASKAQRSGRAALPPAAIASTSNSSAGTDLLLASKRPTQFMAESCHKHVYGTSRCDSSQSDQGSVACETSASVSRATKRQSAKGSATVAFAAAQCLQVQEQLQRPVT
jgi:hypothetical protein